MEALKLKRFSSDVMKILGSKWIKKSRWANLLKRMATLNKDWPPDWLQAAREGNWLATLAMPDLNPARVASYAAGNISKKGGKFKSSVT